MDAQPSDPIQGEMVVAFVILTAATAGSEDLIKELQQTIHPLRRSRLPRRTYVADGLPPTPSGKMQRFLLRKEIPVA